MIPGLLIGVGFAVGQGIYADPENKLQLIVIGVIAVVIAVGVGGFDWPIYRSKSPIVHRFIQFGPMVLALLGIAVAFSELEEDRQSTELAPIVVPRNALPEEETKRVMKGLQNVFSDNPSDEN